jgi:hypothetical protein
MIIINTRGDTAEAIQRDDEVKLCITHLSDDHQRATIVTINLSRDEAAALILQLVDASGLACELTPLRQAPSSGL